MTETRTGDVEPIRHIKRYGFWERVVKTETCWVWIGHRQSDGYGRIKKDGRSYGAHRLSWEMQFGPIPAGLQVLHHCDNPPCIRPDHLFVGTRSDNMRDMLAKGRYPVRRGAGAATAKATTEDIATIRRLHEQGQTTRQIAAQVGLSKSTIAEITAGRRWSDV